MGRTHPGGGFLPLFPRFLASKAPEKPRFWRVSAFPCFHAGLRPGRVTPRLCAFSRFSRFSTRPVADVRASSTAAMATTAMTGRCFRGIRAKGSSGIRIRPCISRLEAPRQPGSRPESSRGCICISRLCSLFLLSKVPRFPYMDAYGG